MTSISNSADLSFPDQDVVGMRIDRENSIAVLSMTGAWLNGPVGKGDLILSHWRALQQRRFASGKNLWLEIPHGSEEPLKDICEFIIDDDIICLRGFGKNSGEWIEMRFNGGQACWAAGSTG